MPVGHPTLAVALATHRKNGFGYVDKTTLVTQILTASEYSFLSRPRRFGKPMLLNAIKAVILGNRALFEGLWIESKLDEFEVHPVIKIHFGNGERIAYQILTGPLPGVRQVAHPKFDNLF